jgi:hypothetical protein
MLPHLCQQRHVARPVMRLLLQWPLLHLVSSHPHHLCPSLCSSSCLCSCETCVCAYDAYVLSSWLLAPLRCLRQILRWQPLPALSHLPQPLATCDQLRAVLRLPSARQLCCRCLQPAEACKLQAATYNQETTEHNANAQGTGWINAQDCIVSRGVWLARFVTCTVTCKSQCLSSMQEGPKRPPHLRH